MGTVVNWACLATGRHGTLLTVGRVQDAILAWAQVLEQAVVELVQRTIGSTHWHVLPDWEPVLLGAEGLRLEAWRAEGRVEVVKHGEHRTVYRVALEGRAFYVKHYHSAGFWRTLQHLIRSSAARREWRQALEIARRGVATIRPVAWAEVRREGMVRESYLLTEAIEPSSTVQQYALERLETTNGPPQSRGRRCLLEGFARFVAAVHRAGIWHNDFHAGNVLVGAQAPGEPSGTEALFSFHLIDVPGVRLSGPLSWRASAASLAMISSAWWRRTTRTERLRFWRTYLAGRPELHVPGRREAIEQLDAAARGHARRIHRGRDKRSLRVNRDYQVVCHRDVRVHGVYELAEPVLRRLAENPEKLLWDNLHRPVKLSHSSMIVEASLLTSHGCRPVVYKCYRPRNWWKAFCAIFRQGRALRSWRLGQALFERSISTARPLAVCTPQRPRFGRRTYLATEWIEGAENLHLYGWRLARRDSAQQVRRAVQCAISLGELVGRMHGWGVVHGDLKGSNLLVVEEHRGVKTYVIDVDGVQISSHVPPSGQVADLARLATSLEAHPWVPRTVCCRFLRAYARQFPPGTIAWKELWRKVARASRRITGRKRRRKEVVL